MTDTSTAPWWRQARIAVPAGVGLAAVLIAGGWALTRAGDETAPPAASPSPTPSVSVSATGDPAAASAQCAATVNVTSEWEGGYQADITVTAGDVALTDWTVELDLGSSTVASAWNSTLATGATGTTQAGNLDYNAAVPAGSSTAFGFTADGAAEVVSTGCVTSTSGDGHHDHRNAASDEVPAPVNAASDDDWLSVDGNRLVNAQGDEVWLTGANWFGFNTSERVLHGLWSVNLESTLAAVADRGLNVLRIPISTQLLLEWRAGQAGTTSNVNAAANPDLEGLTTLEIFDVFLEQSKAHGIKVILDVHSAKADNAGHTAPVWHTDAVSEEDFFVAWEWVAQRYAHDDTIIGFDLKNEPHGKPPEQPRASWGDGEANDWQAVASEAAQRIHAIHPDVLLLVEGIEATPKIGTAVTSTNPDDWDITWWGGNLSMAGDIPVEGPADKIMYSPHDYGPLVYEQPWFQGDFTAATLEDDVWGPFWLYLHDDGVSPLLIGEWGGRLGQDERQDRWLTSLRDLIQDRRLHHTFWSLNPNSGDTGGLLLDDWTTWDEDKMALLDPVLWKNEAGQPQGLDHEIPLG
ncbi:cellulase family glycosylhydrolase [Demequina globuliformis]|uniref:cellulase family glycosylhydrolase n=1 Tax=Demequina globuliformis TaxID=676202 RepID=UPI000AFD78BA|nr:cellulase family glycosylhydrolase [Demequina globuliformis]